jgi:hypothetical protein
VSARLSSDIAPNCYPETVRVSCVLSSIPPTISNKVSRNGAHMTASVWVMERAFFFDADGPHRLLLDQPADDIPANNGSPNFTMISLQQT